jgi:hypothetical protein
MWARWLLSAAVVPFVVSMAGTILRVHPRVGSAVGGTQLNVFGVDLFAPQDLLAVAVSIGEQGSTCMVHPDLSSPSLVVCTTVPGQPMQPDGGVVTVGAPGRVNHCIGAGISSSPATSTCSFTFALGAFLGGRLRWFPLPLPYT